MNIIQQFSDKINGILKTFDRMIIKLFNAVTDAIRILQEAQVQTENIFIDSETEMERSAFYIVCEAFGDNISGITLDAD